MSTVIAIQFERVGVRVASEKHSDAIPAKEPVRIKKPVPVKE